MKAYSDWFGMRGGRELGRRRVVVVKIDSLMGEAIINNSQKDTHYRLRHLIKEMLHSRRRFLGYI